MLALSFFTKVDSTNSEKSCKVTVYYFNGGMADHSNADGATFLLSVLFFRP